MDDDQRKAMCDEWKNSKTWLKIKVERTEEKSVVSTKYKGKEYSQTFHQKDCIGTAHPFIIAYNKLQTELKQVDKNIELIYPL